jgi:hypothetical protein
MQGFRLAEYQLHSMNDAAPLISVVLPAHNEEGNVAAMAQRLTAILAPIGSFEIVFDHGRDRHARRRKVLVLGIIGEYVGRILRETRRRPSLCRRATSIVCPVRSHEPSRVSLRA